MGDHPACVGKKLKMEYHANKEEDWFEVAIDVFTSKAWKNIVGIVEGWSKKLIIDLVYVIEATTTEELPEQILGGFRLVHWDVTNSRKLKKSKGNNRKTLAEAGQLKKDLITQK